MAGTTPARVDELIAINSRLRAFLARAAVHGWTVEPSTAAPDCIPVRHPTSGDHFVLYPSGAGRTASLSVYDGRDGHEFSPIAARSALAFILENRVTDG